MPEIVLAATATINGVVAPYESLQCPALEDLPHFYPMFQGAPIIMGRKTRELLRGPIIGSRNIVMSRTVGYTPVYSEVSNDIHEAIQRVKDEPRVFVIGGPRLFNRVFHLADRLCITEINAVLSGRIRFPEIFHTDWELVSKSPLQNRDSDAMSFRLVEYIRRS